MSLNIKLPFEQCGNPYSISRWISTTFSRARCASPNTVRHLSTAGLAMDNSLKSSRWCRRVKCLGFVDLFWAQLLERAAQVGQRHAQAR